MKSSDINIMSISQEMPQPSITKICLKSRYIKFPRGQSVNIVKWPGCDYMWLSVCIAGEHAVHRRDAWGGSSIGRSSRGHTGAAGIPDGAGEIPPRLGERRGQSHQRTHGGLHLPSLQDRAAVSSGQRGSALGAGHSCVFCPVDCDRGLWPTGGAVHGLRAEFALFGSYADRHVLLR